MDNGCQCEGTGEGQKETPGRKILSTGFEIGLEKQPKFAVSKVVSRENGLHKQQAIPFLTVLWYVELRNHGTKGFQSFELFTTFSTSFRDALLSVRALYHGALRSTCRLSRPLNFVQSLILSLRASLKALSTYCAVRDRRNGIRDFTVPPPLYP